MTAEAVAARASAAPLLPRHGGGVLYHGATHLSAPAGSSAVERGRRRGALGKPEPEL